MTCETIGFEITGSGLRDTIGFWIIILILSLGFIIIGFWREEPVIIMFGTFGLYFIGIYSMFNGIVGIKDDVTTYAISIIVLGIAAYLSTRSGLEIINNGV